MSSRKKEEKLCSDKMAEQAVGLGRQIQQDREEAGFSREEVEHITKISPFFLEAVEAGRFFSLPGEVFCKGFITNIYKVLKRDPQAVIAEIEAVFLQISQAQLPGERKRTLPPRGSVNSLHKPEKSRLRYWGAVAILVIVGGTIIWRVRHSRSASESMIIAPVTTEPLTAVTPPTPDPVIAQTVNSMAPAAGEAAGPLEINTQLPALAPPLLPVSPAVPEDLAGATTAPRPELPAPAEAVAPLSGSQLTMVVRAPVGIQQKIDSQEALSKEYPQGEYQFAFEEKAEFVVQDAAEVSFTFDSKTIDTLGKKKETKKITFVHSKQEKPLVQ